MQKRRPFGEALEKGVLFLGGKKQLCATLRRFQIWTASKFGFDPNLVEFGLPDLDRLPDLD